ncbi:MAG: methyltransferase [Saprospirales bacterium]|nr:methyltransferase [Saprospirales bacterium]
MASQRKLVQSFFDRLAPAYRERYEGRRVFLKYLHLERVDKALQGRDLSGKTVLDIGAGTGILYDRLQQTKAGADYYACDISAPMLAQSKIPSEKRRVGTPRECDFPIPAFDYIFLLGVTTYLSEEEFSDMLDYIAAHLAEGGTAVISFSNRLSVDFQVRRLAAAILPRRILKKTVLGQAFPFKGYGLKEAKALVPGALRAESCRWLNATVFPFNRLFPRLSVAWARLLLRFHLPGFLCADFLLFLRKQ